MLFSFLSVRFGGKFGDFRHFNLDGYLTPLFGYYLRRSGRFGRFGFGSPWQLNSICMYFPDRSNLLIRAYSRRASIEIGSGTNQVLYPTRFLTLGYHIYIHRIMG